MNQIDFFKQLTDLWLSQSTRENIQQEYLPNTNEYTNFSNLNQFDQPNQESELKLSKSYYKRYNDIEMVYLLKWSKQSLAIDRQFPLFKLKQNLFLGLIIPLNFLPALIKKSWFKLTINPIRLYACSASLISLTLFVESIVSFYTKRKNFVKKPMNFDEFIKKNPKFPEFVQKNPKFLKFLQAKLKQRDQGIQNETQISYNQVIQMSK